jgi:3'(2'), 5'-bisphosphate nucleotidase
MERGSRFQVEAAFAAHAVRAAARLSRIVQREMVEPAQVKADRSPVTVADFAVQAVVAHLLEASCPTDTLVAEEDSALLRRPEQGTLLETVTRFVRQVWPEATAREVCRAIDRGAGAPVGRYWTLDPIDGTKGFLRGDQYVTALALLERGEVQVAALGCPNLNAELRPEVGGEGALAVALRGQGAWAGSLDGGSLRRLQVSAAEEPSSARILRSFEAAHTDEAQVSRLAEALGCQAPPVRMDSQAKFAVLAAGSGELIVRLLSPSRPDYAEKIWDQAAGSLIVEEAGGQVTDLTGRPLDFHAGRELRRNLGILVSNRRLHPAAVAALHAIGADRRPQASADPRPA